MQNFNISSSHPLATFAKKHYLCKMNEQFLQYVWFSKRFAPQQTTIDGLPVEIIDTGQRNTDAGPDVFNAKVKIDGTLWAGNVEFHRRASDWLRHGHATDPAYNSVVLHVVLESDCAIARTDGQTIPQMQLRFAPELATTYEQLMSETRFVRCANSLKSVSEAEKMAWLDRLLIERLEQKTHAIEVLLQQTTNDWDEAFYVVLARNFGFSTNAFAFERLAKSLPLAIIGKHRNSEMQIEALLFGQAGMLEGTPKDDYQAQLQHEYNFLKAKFNLTPIDASLWKFLRLRPANFPTIRLSQFGNLAFRSHRLFSQIIANDDETALRQLFECETTDYWLTHYRFGEHSKSKPKRLAEHSINLLLINTVAPFLFCYGRTHNDERTTQRAIDLLSNLPAEKNHIVDGFAAEGIVPQSAADTQALIQLKRAYCDTHNCLRCRFANFVFKKIEH